MAKLGNAVAKCSHTRPPDESEAGPVDEAKHKTCAIKILSIKEKDNEAGADLLGGGTELFVKGLLKDLIIKYEVKVCGMSVSLWLEFDSGNKVHSDFYSSYEGNGVTKPRVVSILDGESRDPGTHEALWDGRDKTPDHRILLDGTYKVRIQGLHDATVSDSSTLRVMPAFAWNFGIDYPNNSSKKETDHASKSQKQLSDGTGFVSNTSCGENALDAWLNLRSSAVGVISGHSNPVLVVFYPEQNQPGKPVHYRSRKESFILTNSKPNPPPPHPKADIDNSVFLPQEPADALRDMFLMVLAGCRAGNEVLLIQTHLTKLSKAYDPKGIDGKHGKHTTAALKAWQQGEGIEPADGSKNDATLSALGVNSSLTEPQQTTEVQRKLTSFSKRYNPGKADGVWGDDTEAAITHYQEAHSPPLEVNSLPDRPTLKHMHPAGSMGGEVRDIAEAFGTLGCNIVVAFTKKVSFAGCEKWHIKFWSFLKDGSGIEDAAREARNGVSAMYSKELDFIFYVRDGVDKNSTLHPARHGRDL